MEVVIEAGDTKQTIISKLESIKEGPRVLQGVTIEFDSYWDDKFESETPDFVEEDPVNFTIPSKRFTGDVEYGPIKQKPHVTCSYLSYNEPFSFSRLDNDGINGKIARQVQISNLYYYPATMSFDLTKGSKALKKHLECLYYGNLGEKDIKVTIDMTKDENKATDTRPALNEVFQNAIRIQRDENENITGNPFYYCSSYTEPESETESGSIHTYILRKVNRTLPKGGSSPSIARWMGAIAGTFVVVASAFVPRLG